MILQVITIAIIKAEAWDIISSVISVFQTIMFVGTYSIFLVNACKSLSEYHQIDQSNLSQYHGTSTLKYESEVFVSPYSVAALTEMLLIMSGDVELIPGPQRNI